ncbi:MAG: DUF1156 domain-containing protein [Victivallales bacterium]|nr:DUF1156 domain-containing protein [Victivallales bacterium]
MTKAFIEKQFPVSKVSKESYKERKAGASQTLTGLGKWWGRKPLILVRAAILGCLMPASDDAVKDNAIFLKILSMDEAGFEQRKNKKLPVATIHDVLEQRCSLWDSCKDFFSMGDEKVTFAEDTPTEKKAELEHLAFSLLGYDEKQSYCMRPEHLENLSEESWAEINAHLGTKATSLSELIAELSIRRFGHNVVVGDCFSGGGSIPFEAARMGCDAYGSDLNPVASLLTWADIHLCGASEEELKEIQKFQQDVYNAVDKEIEGLGIERNEKGDKAVSYLYCVEARCPECGMKVPLAPSWVIGKGTKTVAQWTENGDHYNVTVKMGATAAEMAAAEKGTVPGDMLCPHCGKSTPISVLRHDTVGPDGKVVYGHRLWGKDEFEPAPDDVFQERLYAVKYEHTEMVKGKEKKTRYYQTPSERDLQNEEKVRSIVRENFSKWQQEGLVPSMEIETGYNTDQLIRERGWKYWHQLFNPRQLINHSLLIKYILINAKNTSQYVSGCLCLHKCLDVNAKLCRHRNDDTHPNANTFYNQALNTFDNYAVRSWFMTKEPYILSLPIEKIQTDSKCLLLDARDIDTTCDFWITDPPYKDAVNYHELSEFFLAWDKTLIKEAFPEWYADSKRVLAVRGDEHFSQTMIDIYANLTKHTSDDGMHVVMFTHSDPAVWAQLALIMWKAGLTVTAAWNIATETDASGLKDGNYVKGTVLLVLRKQTNEDEAFLDELASDIRREVRQQIESMQKLDDKEDPNFSDPDYVLAAYAASLKVLTGYKSIGEIELNHELNLAINSPDKSEVVKLIERAKKIAYDFIIPPEFDSYLWKELAPAERFYLKGLEAEKHGNYQISTYQEYARGFGLTSYSPLMANERANTARLKTPSEFAMRQINDVPNFENGLLRLALEAIHISIKEDEQPDKGLWNIKNTLQEKYWNSRDMLKQLLAFLKETSAIATMSHWHQAAQMAEHLYVLIDNDHI